VFGGSSDYLVPALAIGASGCVTGMGNVFPGSTAAVYDLWTEGKVEEAKSLQQLVANAEWACKKSLALTKFGAYHFVGEQLGLKLETFSPRKPYFPCNQSQREWTIETMSILSADEKAIVKAKQSSKKAAQRNGTH